MSDRIAAAVLLTAAVVVRLAEPGPRSMYPPCPFRWLTGLECPGCGALRALHALTQGDIAGAWALNPLFVVFVFALLVAAIARATGVTGRIAPAWTYGAIPTTVVVFWVVRNV